MSLRKSILAHSKWIFTSQYLETFGSRVGAHVECFPADPVWTDGGPYRCGGIGE